VCVANAYFIKDGNPELIMENVEIIQGSETNVWHLTDLFGHQKQITARLQSLHLLENRFFFEALRAE